MPKVQRKFDKDVSVEKLGKFIWGLKEKTALDCIEKLGGIEGLATKLYTDPENGLDASEDLEYRQNVFGENKIPPPPPKSLFEFMREALNDATLQILMVAALISLILGLYENPTSGWIEGTAILIAVVIVVMVTAVNDYTRELQFRKLSALSDDKKIKVIRYGNQSEISIFDVLVGDVVELETGDEIPADGILFYAQDLKVDESAMTGETDAIKKNLDGNFYMISGCSVLEGVGKMIVIAVGVNAEKGKITTRLTEEDEEETPLQAKLEEVAKYIGNLGLAVAILTLLVLLLQFFYHLYSTGTPFEMHMLEKIVGFVITAITIVVVAVPEGLPLAVTISLAYSMMKMLKDKNLVRHLDACETMGGATNICSDKTGTLTENRMTVTAAWFGNELYETIPSKTEAESSLDDEFRNKLLEGISLNSTAYIGTQDNGQPKLVGSKTECALLLLTQDWDYNYDDARTKVGQAKVWAFSSARKRMQVLTPESDEKHILYTKGASEIVLDFCTKIMDAKTGEIQELTEEAKDDIKNDIIEKFASMSLRTLALAYSEVDATEKDWIAEDAEVPENDQVLLGIVGIKDPVRAAVPDAVAQCKKAGITVRMVTGDNLTTAKAIATECGIYTEGGLIMEGKEFRELAKDEDKLSEILSKLQVLARSSPDDKYILVSGLRERGEVVAVTGDGTNDAPALKQADVGFAMGIAGTDVAKAACDIILTDDNFTSIVKAVMWGRNVYDSIRKFLQFQLTVNLVALIVAFVSAVTTGESVLTPVQLLWVNLIMDTMGALALATERPTKALLDRPPYGRDDFLITPTMWSSIIGQTLFQVSVLFYVLYAGNSFFGVEKHSIEHYTIVFNVFVLCQVVNEINSRKIDSTINVFSGIFTNVVFIAILIFTILFQIFIVEFGGSFTATTHLTLDQWYQCAGIALLGLPVGAIIRLLCSPSLKRDPKTHAVTQTTDPAIAKLLMSNLQRYNVHMDVSADVKERRRNKFKNLVEKQILVNRLLKNIKPEELSILAAAGKKMQ